MICNLVTRCVKLAFIWALGKVKTMHTFFGGFYLLLWGRLQNFEFFPIMNVYSIIGVNFPLQTFIHNPRLFNIPEYLIDNFN